MTDEQGRRFIEIAYKRLRKRGAPPGVDFGDIVGDALLKALRTTPYDPERSSFKTWATSMIDRKVSEAIERRRAIKRNVERTVYIDDLSIPALDALAFKRWRIVTSAEYQDEKPERSRVGEGLTEPQRIALELSKTMTRERIGQELGITVHAVGKRLQGAYKRLGEAPSPGRMAGGKPRLDERQKAA